MTLHVFKEKNDDINKLLKKIKTKVTLTKLIKKIKARQYYKKPSIIAKEKRSKAIYKQRLISEMN